MNHETRFNKFKNIEIIPSVFSDHSTITLSQQQMENWKIHKYMEIKQPTLEQPIGQKNSKGEIRKHLE